MTTQVESVADSDLPLVEGLKSVDYHLSLVATIGFVEARQNGRLATYIDYRYHRNSRGRYSRYEQMAMKWVALSPGYRNLQISNSDIQERSLWVRQGFFMNLAPLLAPLMLFRQPHLFR